MSSPAPMPTVDHPKRTARAVRVSIALCVLLLIAVFGALVWNKAQRSPPEVVSPSPSAFPPKAFAPGDPPRLLTPRVATVEQPTLAWERLLAADGSPREDLAALADLVAGYLHSGLGDRRLPIGFNEDLVVTLTDREALGNAALPSDHPGIRDGRVLDRWGTPWQVHPLADDLIQLRSAGPDRRLYTADDLVAPER